MNAQLGLVLAAILSATPRNVTAEVTSPDPTSVAGCYAVKLGPWQPSLNLGRDEAFITPPSYLELRATKGTEGWSKGRYTLLRARGKTALHSGMFWHFAKGREMRLVFTTGFSGLTMSLHPTGESLSGSAETFRDFPRQLQTANVAATRVPCQQEPPK